MVGTLQHYSFVDLGVERQKPKSDGNSVPSAGFSAAVMVAVCAFDSCMTRGQSGSRGRVSRATPSDAGRDAGTTRVSSCRRVSNRVPATERGMTFVSGTGHMRPCLPQQIGTLFAGKGWHLSVSCADSANTSRIVCESAHIAMIW